MELIRKALGVYVVFAFIFVVMGICFIAWPQISISVICYGLGTVVLVLGITKIVGFVKNKENNKTFLFQFNLVLGIFLAVVGGLLIIFPKLIMPLIPVIMGIVILADGVQKVKAGFDAKKMGHEKWALIELVALITCVFGISLIINPFDTSNAMIVLLGLSLLIDGVQNLIVIISTFKLMSTMIPPEQLQDMEYKEENIPEAPEGEVVTEEIKDEDIIIEESSEEEEE